MTHKILFIVAAGSGGHILPALTLANAWKKENPSGRIIVFTGITPLEHKIIQQQTNLEHTFFLSLSKFSLKRWWKVPLIMWQCTSILLKTIFWSLWYKPERVISTGGLLSIPVCIGTRLTRRTTELYELNVIPGKATKALLPWVHIIHTVFAQTPQFCRWKWFSFSKKCTPSAYPLRFSHNTATPQREEILKRINGFDPTRKTLFILGGSQGSRLLNTLTRAFIETTPKALQNLNIIHQTGALEEAEWEEWYHKHNIPALTFSYDPKIQDYYTAADLILCRAGAGTMFEIAWFKKPCIVIPLLSNTTDHQEANAQAMAESYPELFTVIDQNSVTENQGVAVLTLRRLLGL